MIELTEDNLGGILFTDDKVIVQYGAGWCGNCRVIKPKFKRLSEENEGVTFIYADAEKMPHSREFASVTHLPTFAGFVDGKLVHQSHGNKVEVIQEVLDEVTRY